VNEKQRKVVVIAVVVTAIPFAMSLMVRMSDARDYQAAAFLIAAIGVAAFVWQGRKE
jgi:hypothetical protein